MLDLPSGTVMRSWTGWIRPEVRPDYLRYLEDTGLSAYRATPGNLGAFALFRDVDGDRCEVRTISFWQSREHIAAFAGDSIEVAVFYPEDDRYLIDRETTVVHFDLA